MDEGIVAFFGALVLLAINSTTKFSWLHVFFH